MASDDFTDSNGTGLEDHNSNWISLNGGSLVTTLEINNNIVEHEGVDLASGAVCTTSSEDFSEIDFIGLVGGSEARVVALRLESMVSSGYGAIFYDISAGNYTDFILLKDGGFMALLEGSGSWDVTNTYRVKITASGTTTVRVTGFIDGGEIGYYDDSSSPIGPGSPGFGCAEVATVAESRHDNWSDGKIYSAIILDTDYWDGTISWAGKLSEDDRNMKYSTRRFTSASAWESDRDTNSSAGDIEHGIISGPWASAETSQLAIGSWNADAVVLDCPSALPDGVNLARHNGIYGGITTAYRLVVNNNNIILIDNDAVTIRGIQVSGTKNAGNQKGILARGEGGTFDIVVDSCVVKGDSSSTWDYNSGVVGYSPSNTGTLTVTNCVVTDCADDLDRSGAVQCWSGSGVITINVYNCTFSNNRLGVLLGTANDVVTVKNSAVFNNLIDFQVDAGSLTVDYCASDDGDGTNEVDWDAEATDWNANFVNYSTDDRPLDADLIGAGVGPSVDGSVPATDVVGNPRSGATCDIGAFERVADIYSAIILDYDYWDGAESWAGELTAEDRVLKYHTRLFTSMSAFESDRDGNSVAGYNEVGRVIGPWASNDTTNVTFADWNADAILLECPLTLSDGANLARHNGIWGDVSNSYRIASASTVFSFTHPDVTVDGIEINHTGSGNGLRSVAGGGGGIVQNCLIYAATGDTGAEAENTSGGLGLYNTVIFGGWAEAVKAYADITAYNCILVSTSGAGIYRSGGAVTIKNCAVFNNADDFSGGMTLDYNASDDGDDPQTTGNMVDWDNEATDWAANFNDYAAGNFTPLNVDLPNAGVGPSGDGSVPTTDIIGNARSGAVCTIGPFEFFAVGGMTGALFRTFTAVRQEAGDLDGAGSLNRIVTFPRNLAGILSSTGVLARKFTGARQAIGGITFSGVVEGILDLVQRAVEGVLAFGAGVLTRVVTFKRLQEGDLDATGSVTRSFDGARKLIGDLDFSTVFARIVTFPRKLIGDLDFSTTFDRIVTFPRKLLGILGGWKSDDFTGSDDDPPDTDKWTEIDADNALDIQSNKLNFAYTGTSDIYAEIKSKWVFLGGEDFDVRIDFDSVVLDAPDGEVDENTLPSLLIFDDPDTPTEWVAIGRLRVSTFNGYSCGGDDDSNQLDGTRQDSSGKLRIQKSGSTVKAWYWTGTAWEWDGSTDGYTFISTLSLDLYVQIAFIHRPTGSSTTVSGNVDNFKVLDGFVGTVTRSGTLGRTVLGVLSGTGIVNRKGTLYRALDGEVSFSGVVEGTIELIKEAMAGAFAFGAGVLTRVVTFKRTVLGDTRSLGSELVVDGSFDGDGSAWNWGTGWSLDDPNNEADCDGSQVASSNLYQNSVVTIGNSYKIIFTISNRTAGQVRIFCGGLAPSAWFDSDDTIVLYMVAVGSVDFYIQADADFIGTVDDVSVKEVYDLKGVVSRKGILGRIILGTVTEVLGSEKITNGDMEIDDNWTDRNSPETNERSDVDKHGGTYSRHIVDSVPSYGGTQSETFALETGKSYKFSFWYKVITNGVRVQVTHGDGTFWALDQTNLVETTWTNVVYYITTNASGSAAFMTFLNMSNSIAGEFYIDDVSLKEVTVSHFAGALSRKFTGARQTLGGLNF
ncbi:hypothetical protein KAR91_03825, partial [Candidatus Pacearchaeota archaeon]|nr:hypothetical protein [Candidatus Pacearchaeota archaeon]